MKKFLTVLLALSVVFTYSFSAVGTVFAASAADETKALTEAVNTYASKIIYDQTGKLVQAPELGTPDRNLTKSAIDAAVAQIIADYTEKVKTEEALAMADGEFTDEEKGKVAEAWTKDLGTYAAIKTALFWTEGNYAKKDGVLYTKAVAEVKATITAKISAVKPADYVNEAAVKTAVANAQKAIDSAENSKSGLKNIINAEAAFDLSMENQKTLVQQEADLAKAKADGKKAVSDAAAKYLADRKAELEKVVANDNYSYSPKQVSEASAELSVLAENVAKVETLYTDRIDNVEITDTVDYAAAVAEINKQVGTATTWAFANKDNFASVIDQFADVDLLVKYATELANSKKNEYDVKTGLAVYNEATVDAKLAEVTKKIKSLDGSAASYSQVKNLMDAIPTADYEAKALNAAKAKGIEAITTGKYLSSNWADDNKLAVEAIQKEYTNIINVAADEAAVAVAVKEAQEKMDAILTINQKEYQTGIATTEAEKYNNDLTAYAKGIAAKTPNEYAVKTIANVVTAAKKAMVDAVIAKNDPKLTDAEIAKIVKDSYPAALAVIDGMKTTAELQAAAQAVEAAIKALASPADLAKKSEYTAAKKMLDNYAATPGASVEDISLTSRNYLSALLSSIQSQEKAAVEKTISDLPKNPGKDDEAAVKGARDAYEAFIAEYPNEQIGNLNTLKAAEKAVSEAKLVDAAKKIASIPANVTSADAEVIEVAKAAYDALTDTEKALFDVSSKALVEKLEKAIAQIDATIAKDVVGTHMKIYSSAAKGYIKISWKASNTTVALDGVEVYRSTKKTTGFKKISTFKVQTSKKYTTGLKKGTKYYYYVKGYKMVDGEKVYTHDSITVGRTFR